MSVAETLPALLDASAVVAEFFGGRISSRTWVRRVAEGLAPEPVQFSQHPRTSKLWSRRTLDLWIEHNCEPWRLFAVRLKARDKRGARR